MRRILTTFLMLAVTGAGASRPDCAPYNDKKLYYFGADGTVFNTGAISYGKLEVAADAAPYLRRFVDMLRARGTEVLMLPLPVLGFTRAGELDAEETRGTPFAQVNQPDYLDKALAYHAATIANLKESGALAVDFMIVAQEARRRNPAVKLFFKQDSHWRPEAAEITAQAIAAVLRRERPALFSALKTDTYVLVDKGEILREIFGWNVRVQLDCPNVTWQPLTESYPNVQAEIQGGGLLDDRPAPILLAGTSYSSQTYRLGFSEYLRHELGADVMNVSLNGGGAITGLLNYYTGRKETEAEPSLLIWEFPAAFAATKTDTSLTPVNLRQLIPLLAIKPQKVDEYSDYVSPELSFSAPVGLKGPRKSFVRFVFSGYETRKLDVIMKYVGGEERLQLIRERTTKFDTYSVEIGGTSALKSLKLALPGGTKGQVKVEFFNY